MRDADNIRALRELEVDFMGMIFYPKSPRYVRSVSVNAGTMPDMPCHADGLGAHSDGTGKRPKTVGVFVDEMPQTLIATACRYRLDYIQLHGNESPTYIDNLRCTLVPDLLPEVRIIKALSVREADDVKRWREYCGHVDLLLFDTKCETMGGSGRQFDWSVLDSYDGDIPFLLSGGIGPDDAQRVRQFTHPRCIGIDINSKFETAPAMKDIPLLKKFIKKVR